LPSDFGWVAWRRLDEVQEGVAGWLASNRLAAWVTGLACGRLGEMLGDMDTPAPHLIGPLYHGTRAAAARAILREGFRRSRSRSYTGTSICLSESLTLAYEYGMYETGGCVLEAWLAPTACWTDRLDGLNTRGDAWDEFFAKSGTDAVRGFGGNVWVVWNPAVLVYINRMTHREAIRRLCAEFDEDGPHCGYNGVVSDYASLWWKQDATDPNLIRFPDHCRQLLARLKRFVGCTHSTRT